MKLDLFEHRRIFDRLPESEYNKLFYEKSGKAVVEISRKKDVSLPKDKLIILETAKFIEKDQRFHLEKMSIKVVTSTLCRMVETELKLKSEAISVAKVIFLDRGLNVICLQDEPIQKAEDHLHHSNYERFPFFEASPTGVRILFFNSGSKASLFAVDQFFLDDHVKWLGNIALKIISRVLGVEKQYLKAIESDTETSSAEWQLSTNDVRSILSVDSEFSFFREECFVFPDSDLSGLCIDIGEENIGIEVSETQQDSIPNPHKIPLDILESRELKYNLIEFDLELVKNGSSKDIIKADVLNSEAAAIKLALGIQEMSVDQIEDLLTSLKKFGNSHLILICLEIMKDALLGDNEAYLEHFSGFIKQTMMKYGESTVLKSFYSAGLAFGWSRVDFDKSFAAYSIHIQNCSNKEMIFLLMHRLCARFSEVEKEKTVLGQWLEIASSNKVRIYILERLLVLHQEGAENLNASADTAQKILKLDPANSDAIHFLLARFEQDKRHEDSIQVLTRAIKFLDNHGEYEKAANYDLNLAEIWLAKGRQDIAEQRVRSAISRSSGNTKADEMLESILSGLNDKHKVLEHYLGKIETALTESKDEQVGRLRTKLHKLLASEKNHDQLIDLETRFVPLNFYEMDNIVDLQNLKASSSTWMRYFEALREKTNSEFFDCLNATHLTVLIAIVKNQMNDIHLAADLYCSRLRFRFDKNDLDKVEQSFQSRKKLKKLLSVYRHCLEMVEEDEEKQLLMNKMLSVPYELSDEDRNSIVISLMQMDETNDIPIKKRLVQLIDLKEWKQVFDLSIRGLQLVQFHFRKVKWIKEILALLDDSDGEEKEDIQIRLYKFLLDLEDDDVIAQEIIKKFGTRVDNTTVQSAVQKILHSGITPSIEEKFILEILKSRPVELGGYFELKGLAAHETEKRFGYFKKAYDQYSQDSEQTTKSEYCMQQFLEHGFYLDLFPKYRSLIEESDNHASFVNTLIAAQRVDKDNIIGLEEYKFAINYLKGKASYVTRLAEICKIYMDRFGASKEITVLYLDSLSKIGDVKTEVDFLKTNLVGDLRNKFVLEIDVLQRLHSLGQHDFVKDYAHGRIEKPENEDIKADFLSLAVDLDLVTPVEKGESFEVAVKAGNRSLIEKSWYSMIQDLNGVTVAREFYEHSRSAIMDMGMESLWIKLISNIMKQVDFQSADESASFEIMILAGIELLETDSFLDVSEELLDKAYLQNQNDDRIWMPYYLVLRKNENISSLVSLLEFMIPKVSRNLSVLKSYPVTVESLETELKELSTAGYQRVVGGYEQAEQERTSSSASHHMLDWRKLINGRKLRKGMAGKLNDRAFASILEKHIALQVVTLLTGEFQYLANLRGRVWRNADAYDYPLNGRGRYPSGFSHPLLGSPLHQLIGNCVPALALAFKERFSIKYIAQKIGCEPRDVMNIRNPMRWDSAFLPEFGFKHYQEKLDKQRYVVFDLAGLKDEIFFDGSQRSFYFDAEYYKNKPMSHLFHKILFTSWALKFNYYVPIVLDVRTQVLPFFDELSQRCEKSLFSGIREKIMGPTSNLDLAFQKVDLDSSRQLLEQIGGINPAKIYELMSAMQDHVARLQLSETLDLVGIVEALSGLDLENQGEMKLFEIYDVHDAVENLILFACNIKL